MRLANPHLAIDLEAEESGRWFPGQPEWGDTELLISSIAAPAYRAALRSRRLDSANLSSEQQQQGFAELAADHLLKGWRGKDAFRDTSGNVIPYSIDVCRAILTNRANRRLLNFIILKATDDANFEYRHLEDDVKN